LFAIVILATWKTSSWIGVDGVIASYRQRRNDRSVSTEEPGVTETVRAHAKAA
jgi:hypothetical protein